MDGCVLDLLLDVFCPQRLSDHSDPLLSHKEKNRMHPRTFLGFHFSALLWKQHKYKVFNLFVCWNHWHNIMYMARIVAKHLIRIRVIPHHSEQLQMCTTCEAARHREGQQNYRGSPGSRRKACCDHCSDEQGDRYDGKPQREKMSSLTVIRQRLQLR